MMNMFEMLLWEGNTEVTETTTHVLAFTWRGRRKKTQISLLSVAGNLPCFAERKVPGA
jgi:hypothetical protein